MWFIKTLAALFFVAITPVFSYDTPESETDRLVNLGSRRLHQTGKESNLPPFFNLGKNPFHWDHDAVLAGLAHRDTKSKGYLRKGKVEQEAFLRAGNLAKHLELEPVLEIHVEVPLNFILIGFDGDGHHGLSLEEEELRRWFQHMDFEMTQTRVQVDPILPNSGGNSVHDHLPTTSVVHYNYSTHIVEVGSEVAETFQRALKLYRRPVDPTAEDGGGMDQIDAAQMNALVESLLREMGVANTAYNILLFNPKQEPSDYPGSKEPRPYGYRIGLSRQEAEYLRSHSDDIPMVGGSPGSAAHYHKALKDTLGEFDWDHPRGREKFEWNSYLKEDASSWADKVSLMLDSLESARGAVLSSPAPQGGHVGVLKEDVASVMHGENQEAAFYIKEVLGGSGGGENCLVDTWVGQGRYTWADLTAGPFTWGPAVGGVGIREPHSLPSVSSFLGHLPEGTGKVEGLDEELERMADIRFEEVDEDEVDEVELIEAELDVYEMFALEHCANRQRHIPLCLELSEWVASLEEKLAEATQERDAAGVDAKPKHRHHQWTIFGSDTHVANFSAARDLFLAELGSSISSAVQYSITPSLATPAFVPHRKLSFLLYVVTDHEEYSPTAEANFPVHILKRELERLVVGPQQFQLAVHRMKLGDDPALALGFSQAVRTAVVPSVQPGGTFQARTRRYLDAKALRHQLLEVNKNRGRWVRGKKGESSQSAQDAAVLEVPIFLISLAEESGQPLLIDKHYQAKSLEDLVLVVQNRDQAWDSHLTCNNRTLTWNLRNPIKAALVSVAQHVGGALPAHISHSEGETQQAWLWATGSHAASPTCPAALPHPKFSQLYLDTVHRSYAVSGLDLSALAVNEGVAALAQQTTTGDHAFDTFTKLQLVPELKQELDAVYAKWATVVKHLWELKYSEAVMALPALEQRSNRFRQLAIEIAAAMHPVNCTRRRTLQLGRMQLAGVGIVVVSIAVIMALRPRKMKPKIN